LAHDGVLDTDACKPPGRRRLVDRGFVEVLVQRLPAGEATAKELIPPRDRDPRHIVEDLVDADPCTGVRIGEVVVRRDETQARIARAWIDLRAIDEQGRVPAPAARLCAELMELGDGANLD
jgi:hypothetical protein